MIGKNHDELLNRINGNAAAQTQQTNEKSVKSASKNHHKLEISEASLASNLVPVQKYEENIDIYDNNSLIQVKILYETSDLKQNINEISNCKTEFEAIVPPCIHKCDINENNSLSESLIKGQTLLTSYFQPIHRKRSDSIEIQTFNHDPDDSFELIISDNETTDKHLLLCGKRISRKYRCLKISKYLTRKRISEFLVQVARKSRKQFATNYRRFSNEKVTFVHQCLILYHRFISAYVEFNTTDQKISTKMTTEAIAINRRVQKLLNDNNTSARETNDENVATTHSHSDASAKRLPKNQRTSDNSRLLLLTENAQESSEKDFRK